MESTATKPTILFIHGLWMTSLSWESWMDRYQRAGYPVMAPSWPGLEAGVEALRKDPGPLANLGAKAILDHYTSIIRGLPELPVIVGHSFGGAFTQVLIDRGLGRAGVLIDSAPTRGVLKLPLSTLRSTAHVLANPFNLRKAVPFSRERFRYAFGNTLTQEQSDAAYDRYAIPAAGRVLFEGALANVLPGSALKVDYNRAHRAPLLFIAGGSDHVVPRSAVQANMRKYARNGAVIDFKEFPGRSHFIVGHPGWEEVADFALAWIERQTS